MNPTVYPNYATTQIDWSNWGMTKGNSQYESYNYEEWFGNSNSARQNGVPTQAPQYARHDTTQLGFSQ